MAQPDDMFGDEDYPAYSMGSAAQILGTTPGFLRSLDDANLLVPRRRHALREDVFGDDGRGGVGARAAGGAEGRAPWLPPEPVREHSGRGLEPRHVVGDVVRLDRVLRVLVGRLLAAERELPPRRRPGKQHGKQCCAQRAHRGAAPPSPFRSGETCHPPCSSREMINNRKGARYHLCNALRDKG